MSIFDRKIELDEFENLRPGSLSGYRDSANPPLVDDFSTSCLDRNSKDYFEKREEELLKLNEEINEKKNQALKRMQDAVRDITQTKPSYDNRTKLSSKDLARSKFITQHPNIVQKEGLLNCDVNGLFDSSDINEEKNKFANMKASAPKEIENLQATTRLQKTRIIALQDELDQLHQKSDSQQKFIEQQKNDQKKADETIKKLEKQLKDLGTNLDKSSKKITDESSKSNQYMNEIKSLKQENESQKQLIKKMEQEASQKEAKISKLSDELEKWKSQAVEYKGGNVLRVSNDKQEIEKLTTECKRMEKQRNELLNGFKKQLKLIDILKKQKAHIEASKFLSFTEEEFIKSLELGDKIQ